MEQHCVMRQTQMLQAAFQALRARVAASKTMRDRASAHVEAKRMQRLRSAFAVYACACLACCCERTRQSL